MINQSRLSLFNYIGIFFKSFRSSSSFFPPSSFSIGSSYTLLIFRFFEVRATRIDVDLLSGTIGRVFLKFLLVTGADGGRLCFSSGDMYYRSCWTWGV